MMKKGITFVETLIATSIIAFIIGLSFYLHNKLFQSSFLVDETGNLIVNVLNLAKEKALVAEENNNWGVLLVNTTTDYIYLFKGTESNLKQRFNLPKEVTFFDFDQKSIIFQKNTGQTLSTTIKIGLPRGNIFKYIKISSFGIITISDNP